MEAIRRKIRKSLYKAGRRGLVLMALLFLCMTFCLGQVQSRMEAETLRLTQEAEEPPQWAKSGEEDAIHGFEKAGLHILSREEQEEEEKNTGKIRKEHILLHGTYIQLLQSFDIIKSEYRGASFTVFSITRDDTGLSIKGELRTFRSRGTYEEEKYRPHRSGSWPIQTASWKKKQA